MGMHFRKGASSEWYCLSRVCSSALQRPHRNGWQEAGVPADTFFIHFAVTHRDSVHRFLILDYAVL